MKLYCYHVSHFWGNTHTIYVIVTVRRIATCNLTGETSEFTRAQIAGYNVISVYQVADYRVRRYLCLPGYRLPGTTLSLFTRVQIAGYDDISAYQVTDSSVNNNKKKHHQFYRQFYAHIGVNVTKWEELSN